MKMQPSLERSRVSTVRLQGRRARPPQPGSVTFTSFDFGPFLDHSGIFPLRPPPPPPPVLREWGSEGNGITGEEAGGLSEGEGWEGEAARGAFF